MYTQPILTVVHTMNEIIYRVFIQKLTIKWFYYPLFPLSTPILGSLPSLRFLAFSPFLPSVLLHSPFPPLSFLSVPSLSHPYSLLLPLPLTSFFPLPAFCPFSLLPSSSSLSPLPSPPLPSLSCPHYIAPSSRCRSHSSPDCFSTGSECCHDTAEARCLGRRLRWRVNHVLI